MAEGARYYIEAYKPNLAYNIWERVSGGGVCVVTGIERYSEAEWLLDQLNAAESLRAQVAQLTAELEVAHGVLHYLYDEQNGAPLIMDAPDWNDAMALTERVLGYPSLMRDDAGGIIQMPRKPGEPIHYQPRDPAEVDALLAKLMAEAYPDTPAAAGGKEQANPAPSQPAPESSAVCEHCEGTGSDPNAELPPCPECDGTGLAPASGGKG